MAGRIRSIKPEILTDEKAAGLSHEAWRLWVSMFVLADDAGNLPASPRLLAAQVFWARPADVAPALAELVEVGLISLYQVHGQQFATICGFARHQKINRPSGAKYPSPVTPDPHGALSEPSVSLHGALIGDSQRDRDRDRDSDLNCDQRRTAPSEPAPVKPVPVSARKGRTKKPPHPDHQRWIDLFTELYHHRFGHKPTWLPKQLGTASLLLRTHGYDRCAERAKVMLTNPPSWLKGGCDIGTLAANFDKLVNGSPQRAAQHRTDFQDWGKSDG